jgi:hypothetical protein
LADGNNLAAALKFIAFMEFFDIGIHLVAEEGFERIVN